MYNVDYFHSSKTQYLSYIHKQEERKNTNGNIEISELTVDGYLQETRHFNYT
jgi:hypothetical protein